MKSSKFIFVLLLVISFTSVNAALFTLTGTVDGSTKIQQYDSVGDLIDALDKSGLKSTFTNYTDSSTASFNLDFRGVPVTLAYEGQNLRLKINDIGVNQLFSGSTRDVSNDLFEDWLKKDGGDALNKLMKLLTQVSPYDPLAGNPSSLMGGMVSQDFNRGTSPSLKSDIESSTTNVVEVGLRLGNYTSNGVKGRSLTMPFSYVIKFDSNPQHQLIFDMPLTYFEVGEAQSYNASFGVGYRIPITDNWKITPSAGTGVVGSIDFGTIGQIISYSITSDYYKKLKKFRFGIGNMIGSYKSAKFGISDYEYDPDIKNTVLRNGVLLSLPHMLFGMDTESEIFVFDTRYFGDKLFMEQYNEFGYSIGTNKDRKDLKRLVRLGISILHSSKTKGYTFNFGYSF